MILFKEVTLGVDFLKLTLELLPIFMQHIISWQFKFRHVVPSMPQLHSQVFTAIERHWWVLLLQYYPVEYSSAPLKWHCQGSIEKLICWVLECDCQAVHVVSHREGEFSFFVCPINHFFPEDNVDVLDWDLIRATDNFSCKAMTEMFL